MVEGITVVKFGMNDGGGNGRSCFGVEIRADAAKLCCKSRPHSRSTLFLTIYNENVPEFVYLLQKINTETACVKHQ